MKLRLTAALLATAVAAHADLTIDVGTHVAAEGDTSFQIAIPVFGGDPVTDLNAIVQIADGGPRVGAANAPEIAAVSYTSSIWFTAPGGFASFFPGAPPSSEIIDPNLALATPGESVTASGTLLTLTIDTTGFPQGNYALKLGATAGGDTTFFNTGAPVATTIINGTLRITSALVAWRLQHFGDDAGDPSLEPTLWGDCADPDADGYDNITEFVIGTSPADYSTSDATPASAGLPSTGSLDTSPTITYSRRTTNPVATTPEVSTDLVTWLPASALFTEHPPTAIPGDTYEFVTLQLTNPPKLARIFFRLRITKPD